MILKARSMLPICNNSQRRLRPHPWPTWCLRPDLSTLLTPGCRRRPARPIWFVRFRV